MDGNNLYIMSHFSFLALITRHYHNKLRLDAPLFLTQNWIFHWVWYQDEMRLDGRDGRSFYYFFGTAGNDSFSFQKVSIKRNQIFDVVCFSSDRKCRWICWDRLIRLLPRWTRNCRRRTAVKTVWRLGRRGRRSFGPAPFWPLRLLVSNGPASTGRIRNSRKRRECVGWTWPDHLLWHLSTRRRSN